MQRRTKEAFIWIINILRKHKIPFKISGGFAARIYGSNRPLVDIDIGVSDKMIKKIIPDVRKYIIYGPKQYVDKNWKVFLLTLQYSGQEIDIYGGDESKLFDRKNKRWIKSSTNIKHNTIKKVYGLSVPIITKDDLIRYKKMLMRKVDRQDITTLS